MSDFNEAGVVALGRYLKSRDYRFTTVTPTTHDFYLRRHHVARTLSDIFGWNLPFAVTSLSDDEWRIFGESGVIAEAQTTGEDSPYLRSKIRYSTLHNLLLMHSGFPTRETDAVFFGPDTYRFIRFVKQQLPATTTCQRILDVGTGSGAAALTLAQRFPQASVTAVDINQQALMYTAINAQVAGVTNLHPLYSNLFSAAEGDYDLIVANPPYLLDAAERSYRHGGGALGEGLAYDIVAGALPRLRVGGRLLLYTGVAIVAGEDALYDRISELLMESGYFWSYEEIDVDVFGEELLEAHYSTIDRIAAIGLVVKR